MAVDVCAVAGEGGEQVNKRHARSSISRVRLENSRFAHTKRV